MVTTELELKPARASLMDNTPVTYNTPMPPKNTKSAGSFVHIMIMNMPRMVAMVIQAKISNPKNMQIMCKFPAKLINNPL